MKKKKILNIRNSLIAGALVVTTALAGLGIHLNNKDNQPVDPTPSENPSTSQTIIDENHTDTPELPGGIVIDPDITEPAITDPVIIEPNETEKPEIPGTSITGNPTGENTNQEITTNPGTITTDPTNPTITEPVITNPIHVHTLGEWVSINDYIEGSYCPEDGKLVRVRLHNYKVSNIETITNNNGTHNSYTALSCSNCNHTRTITRNDVECNYGELTWDTVYEDETCEDCGYKHVVGKHNFNNGIIKGNKIEYSCENEGCGYSYTKPYTPNHNHGGGGTTIPSHTHYFGEWSAWSIWTITTDAEGNKIEYRTRTQSCSECGYVNVEKETRPYNPSHTHNWSAWTVTKAATCTEDGMEERTCSANGCTIGTETRVIPALGHKYGEWSAWSTWTITTDAEGNKIEYRTRTQSCSECGHVNTEKETRPYNPSHTHNWSAWTVTKAATCTEDGIEERTCSANGCTIGTETRVIPASGHKYGEWTVSEDWHVVTKTDGTQVEERTLEQVCSVCGDKKTKTEERTYDPSHTHNWSAWTVTKAATCTEDGMEERTCSADGCTVITETKVIPALGHNMGAYTTTKEATCTEKGIETSTCTRCSHTETKETDALGHNPASTPDSSGDIVCTKCGTVLENVGPIFPPIPDHAHTWSAWTVTKAATCTEAGERTRTCSANGCLIGTETETIPSLGHNMGAYTTTKEASCTEKGIETSACTRCSHTETKETNALGHNPASTPDSSGDIVCTKCGTVLENVGPIFPPIPGTTAEGIGTEDQQLNSIIEVQNQAQADANADADKKLDELLNSGANAAEMDAALDEIIQAQDKAFSDANAKADQQLDEAITNIENAKVDEIIQEQDKAIETAKKNAEAELEAIIASDADAETKDAAIDKVIEETDKAIGEATAKADAQLDALTGVSQENSMTLELIK